MWSKRFVTWLCVLYFLDVSLDQSDTSVRFWVTVFIDDSYIWKPLCDEGKNAFTSPTSRAFSTESDGWLESQVRLWSSERFIFHESLFFRARSSTVQSCDTLYERVCLKVRCSWYSLSPVEQSEPRRRRHLSLNNSTSNWKDQNAMRPQDVMMICDCLEGFMRRKNTEANFHQLSLNQQNTFTVRRSSLLWYKNHETSAGFLKYYDDVKTCGRSFSSVLVCVVDV